MAKQTKDWTDILVKRGIVGADQIVEARQMGPSPEEALVRLGYADLEDITKAKAEQNGLDYIDLREIERGGKSYTVDTLAGLRAEMPQRPIALLVGADAFRGFPSWHRWQELFTLAHIVVVPRPGVPLAQDLPAALDHEWRTRLAADPRALRERTAGTIYVQPVSAQPISSSEIRAALARGARSVEIAGLLPAAVLAYIESKHLYR